MKRRFLFLIFIVSFILATISADTLADVVTTEDVAVGAEVKSILVTVLNVSNNQPTGAVGFGNISSAATFASALQYLEVTCGSTALAWGVQIYTDNASYGGEQKGGLIGANNLSRVPLLWRVYDGVQNSGTGVPCTNSEDWAFVKDKNDADMNGSWPGDGAQIEYRSIVASTGLGAFPSPGRSGSSPVYVYFGADFSGVSSQSYLTQIVIEVYNL
ncbi:hypothetical protein ES706_06023 [subsurface metagenome]|nr:hypothetical protein [Bacillota bacterium]